MKFITRKYLTCWKLATVETSRDSALENILKQVHMYKDCQCKGTKYFVLCRVISSVNVCCLELNIQMPCKTIY